MASWFSGSPRSPVDHRKFILLVSVGDEDQKGLDELLDRLFAAPLDEFTALRDRLAKDLRSDGKAEDAASVKSVRKPTVGAFALNQVARESPKKIEWLMEVYEKLRNPQSPADLREASRSRNQIIAEIVETASRLLESEGHSASEQVKERIARTLQAATEEGAAEVLRKGRLERELQPSGFRLGAGDLERDEREVDLAEGDLAILKSEVSRLRAEAEQLERKATEAARERKRLEMEDERAAREAAAARQRLEEKELELEMKKGEIAELRRPLG